MQAHKERAHAVLSASGSSRWLNCTASAILESKQDDTTSVYAAEGTLAHEFADFFLRMFNGEITESRYKEATDRLRENELYSREMPRQVEKYTDYVIEQFNDAKAKGTGRIFIEERFDLTEYVPESFGTGDTTIIGDGQIEIIDLKYGKGVRVDANDNSQLRLYALGAISQFSLFYDIRQVKMTIVQPRLDHVSSEVISVEELEDWGNNYVRPRAELAIQGKGDLVPGDWCRWCKVKATCAALAAKQLAVAQQDFSSVSDDCELPDGKTMTDEQILSIYQRAADFKSWIDAVTDHVKKEALRGKEWAGFKLVEGRSSRKWTDTEAVKAVLLANGFTEAEIEKVSLRGIGDISDLMTLDTFNELLGPYVHKPPGKPTLVPESDEREPFGLAAAQKDFAE